MNNITSVMCSCLLCVAVKLYPRHVKYIGTISRLEDIYGLKIDKLEDEVCIRLDKNRGTSYISLLERFTAWQKEAEKYRNGEISKEEYDRWRYTYPEVEVQRTRETLDILRKSKKDEQEYLSLYQNHLIQFELQYERVLFPL